jgi:hypothetical protein
MRDVDAAAMIGQPADLTIRAGDAGASVALCIEDAIAKKTVVVTHRVPEEDQP